MCCVVLQEPSREQSRREAATKRLNKLKAEARHLMSAEELAAMDSAAVVPPPCDMVSRQLLRAGATSELYSPLPVCAVCDEFVCSGQPAHMAWHDVGSDRLPIDEKLYRLHPDDLPHSFFEVLRAPAPSDASDASEADSKLSPELRRQYDVSSLFSKPANRVSIRTRGRVYALCSMLCSMLI